MSTGEPRMLICGLIMPPAPHISDRFETGAGLVLRLMTSPARAAKPLIIALKDGVDVGFVSDGREQLATLIAAGYLADAKIAAISSRHTDGAPYSATIAVLIRQPAAQLSVSTLRRPAALLSGVTNAAGVFAALPAVAGRAAGAVGATAGRIGDHALAGANRAGAFAKGAATGAKGAASNVAIAAGGAAKGAAMGAAQAASTIGSAVAGTAGNIATTARAATSSVAGAATAAVSSVGSVGAATAKGAVTLVASPVVGAKAAGRATRSFFKHLFWLLMALIVSITMITITLIWSSTQQSRRAEFPLHLPIGSLSRPG
jgi:hypothetical protein